MTAGTIAESGEGDLRVWLSYPLQGIRGQLYDWSCEVTVANGGLLEETNRCSAMYVAPVSGYTPSFKFQHQAKYGPPHDTGSRRYYVNLKSGKEYGRIDIELCAPFNNKTPGLIRLSYVVNPSGSRILR